MNANMYTQSFVLFSILNSGIEHFGSDPFHFFCHTCVFIWIYDYSSNTLCACITLHMVSPGSGICESTIISMS